MGHQDRYQWDQQMIETLYNINNESHEAVTQKLHRLTYHFYPKCVYMNNNTMDLNQTIFDIQCLANISLYTK